jgi:hypothetical protein
VNSLLSSSKDVFGVFPNVDFSTVNTAAKSRKEMVLRMREGFQKDSQMSDNDRKFYNDMIPDDSDNPQTIARAIAVKQLANQVKEHKAEFLLDAVNPVDKGGKGMNPVAARKAWESQADSVRASVASEEHVKLIVDHLTEGSKDPNLINYIKKLDVGGAAQKVEQQLGVVDTPAPAPADTSTPVSIKGDDDYNSLPSGTLFTGPDGKVRKKP